MYLPRYAGLLSEFDPRGNLIINTEEDEIVVEHTSPTRETLGIYRAKSAEQIRDILVKENIVSLVPHALDIGLELMKAEMAIKMNLHYVQDNRLEIKPLKVEEPKPPQVQIQQNKEETGLLKKSRDQLASILNNLKTR